MLLLVELLHSLPRLLVQLVSVAAYGGDPLLFEILARH